MTKSPSVNVMDCATTRKWVQRKLDGEEMAAGVKKAYDAHIASCMKCHAWVGQLEQSVRLIGMLADPRPSAGFQRRLMRVLGLEPVPVWLRWAAGVALGFSAAWLIGLSLLPQLVTPSLGKGVSTVSRIWGILSRVVVPSTEMVAGMIEIGIVIFAAAIILVILGVVAGRMMRRRKPAEARSY